MALSDVSDPSAIERALNEFDKLGRTHSFISMALDALGSILSSRRMVGDMTARPSLVLHMAFNSPTEDH